MKPVILVLALPLFLSSIAAAQIVAEGEPIRKLAGDLRFGEGPASDAAGNVYFTDQPTDRILKWSVDGKLTTFLTPAGRANGLCFDARGDLWACADEKNELWKITPAAGVEKVVTNYEGRPLSGPNDVWVRPDGGVYFTNPNYPRRYWQRDPAPQNPLGVYFLSADRKSLALVAEGMEQPNGIVGTPDGKTLYVADHAGRKTYRFTVQPDGQLTDRTLFCEQGSDGMTLDADGNVYLTFDGVTVFSRDGAKQAQIDLPPPNRPTNVCFGGADRRTLFITTPDALYAVRTLKQRAGSP